MKVKRRLDTTRNPFSEQFGSIWDLQIHLEAYTSRLRNKIKRNNAANFFSAMLNWGQVKNVCLIKRLIWDSIIASKYQTKPTLSNLLNEQILRHTLVLLK